MKTLILCGGIGYRLKEETEFKPKPMVQIGGKPILWHIMKIYAHYGFNEFIIALGYKGNYIKQFFLNEQNMVHDFTLDTSTGDTKIYKNNNSDNFRITFVNTGEETLVGERILRIKDYIPKKDENFMVTYGDGVSDINIKNLVEFHQKQKTIGTVTGVHPRSKWGLLKINDNKMATSFIEKPVLKREWVNGGFMIFKREFFDYVNPGEMEHEGLKRLIQRKQLSINIHEGFWHSMDTYPDINNLNSLWQKDPKWKVWKD